MVALAEGVLLADRQDDLESSDRVEVPVIVEVGEEVARRVEVDGLVVVTVEEVAEVFDRAGQNRTGRSGRRACRTGGDA